MVAADRGGLRAEAGLCGPTDRKLDFQREGFKGRKQFKGKVKGQWGKLTDDQLDVIAGKRDMLAGKIQEMYGCSKDETEKQLSDWQKRMKEIIHVK